MIIVDMNCITRIRNFACLLVILFEVELESDYRKCLITASKNANLETFSNDFGVIHSLFLGQVTLFYYRCECLSE